MVDYVLADLQIGTLTSGITSGSTTLASASFAAIPNIAAPTIMWMSLDPDGVDGPVEMVKITAHSTSSTSVTVTRGEGISSARSHSAGTKVVAGLVKAVFDEIEDELANLRADVDTVVPSLGQGVKLGKSAAQSIGGGATAFLTWTVETYDPDAWHSGSNSNVTLPFTGFYITRLRIDLDAGDVDAYRYRINSATPGSGGTEIVVANLANTAGITAVETGTGDTSVHFFTSGDEFRVEAVDATDGVTTEIGTATTLHIVYLGS